jgi:hypothetical protein
VGVVTIEELAEAIRNTLVAHGRLPAENAESVATQVLNYFGTEEMVLDNVLSNEDRDMFYQLEEEGLLSSEEEDTLVARGKTWRIHYWLMRKATVEAAAHPPPPPSKDTTGEIYTQMPADNWAHRDERPRTAGASKTVAP